MCDSFKGYSRAKDEPGSNEKTMREGGNTVTHLRLDLDHEKVLVYMYFYVTFSLFLITIESPARNPAFNYICFFHKFFISYFTSSSSEKTFSN